MCVKSSRTVHNFTDRISVVSMWVWDVCILLHTAVWGMERNVNVYCFESETSLINPRKWHCVTVFSIHSRLNAMYSRWYRHNQEWEWQFCIRRPSQTIILLSLYSPCCAAASSLDWLDSSTACKWVNSDEAVCVMFCLMYCCAFQVVHTQHI